jgi:hypothetical protein
MREQRVGERPNRKLTRRFQLSRFQLNQIPGMITRRNFLLPGLHLRLSCTRHGRHDPSNQSIELQLLVNTKEEASKSLAHAYILDTGASFQLAAIRRASITFGLELPDVLFVLSFFLANRELLQRWLRILAGTANERKQLCEYYQPCTHFCPLYHFGPASDIENKGVILPPTLIMDLSMAAIGGGGTAGVKTPKADVDPFWRILHQTRLSASQSERRT